MEQISTSFELLMINVSVPEISIMLYLAKLIVIEQKEHDIKLSITHY
jgi:hypothetical protein